MTSRPRLYLAGPTVFMADAIARGRALQALCASEGCEGVFPFDAASDGPANATRIHAACLALLDRCHAVVADLSPFRGPHVDDGKAFELGYAAARALPIFGYSTDLRTLRARILPRAAGETVDAAGMSIEDFSQPFNAMIAGGLAAPASATPAAAIAAAADHLRSNAR